MNPDHSVDLNRVARAFRAAATRADAAPYVVDFEIDVERQVLIARGTQTKSMWINGSTTGRPLSEVMTNPEAAFDYVFGFLEASFRADG